jgi:lysophospholipase L1-like esterase
MPSFFDLVASLQASIDDLDGIISGGENETVNINGVTKDTISKAIKEKFTALLTGQRSGVIVFETYTLLDAYAPTVEQQTASFKVSNDATTSLNGYYHWISGTSYEKDSDLVLNTVNHNNNSDAVSGKGISEFVGTESLPLAVFVGIDASKIQLFEHGTTDYASGYWDAAGIIYTTGVDESIVNESMLSALTVKMQGTGTGEIHIYSPILGTDTYLTEQVISVSFGAGINTFSRGNGVLPNVVVVAGGLVGFKTIVGSIAYSLEAALAVSRKPGGSTGLGSVVTLYDSGFRAALKMEYANADGGSLSKIIANNIQSLTADNDLTRGQLQSLSAENNLARKQLGEVAGYTFEDLKDWDEVVMGNWATSQRTMVSYMRPHVGIDREISAVDVWFTGIGEFSFRIYNLIGNTLTLDQESVRFSADSATTEVVFLTPMVVTAGQVFGMWISDGLVPLASPPYQGTEHVVATTGDPVSMDTTTINTFFGALAFNPRFYVDSLKTELDLLSAKVDTANQSYWSDKKIAWYGTSISAGYPHTDNQDVYAFPNIAVKKLGGVILNYAKPNGIIRSNNANGTPTGRADEYCFTSTTNGGTNYQDSMVALIGTENDPDLFMFNYGTNDLDEDAADYNLFDPTDPYNATMAITRRDLDTFIGSVNTVIDALILAKPKARFCFVTHFSGDSYNGGLDFSKGNAILEALADYWAVPVLQMYKKTGWINNGITNNIALWAPDGIHPAGDTSGDSVALLAEMVKSFLINEVR